MTYMSYEKFTNQPWWYDLCPGDAWVDWITLDAYVNAKPGGFHNGNFTYLVNRTTNVRAFPGFYSWITKQHPNKPFMVSEWGVFEYPADPARKAAIYAAVLADVEAPVLETTVKELDRRGHLVEVDADWCEGRLTAASRDGRRRRAAANPRGMQAYAAGR